MSGAFRVRYLPGQVWGKLGQIMGAFRDRVGLSLHDTCLGMGHSYTVILKLWLNKKQLRHLIKYRDPGPYPHHPGGSPQLFLMQVICSWHFRITWESRPNSSRKPFLRVSRFIKSQGGNSIFNVLQRVSSATQPFLKCRIILCFLKIEPRFDMWTSSSVIQA